MEPMIDSEIDGLVTSAVKPSDSVNAQAAQAALDSVEVPIVKISGRAPTVSESSAVPSVKGKLKSEIAAELEQTLKDAQVMRARLEILEAKSNEQAVKDLGATIALAIQISGQFVAAKRGQHWLFSDTEAKVNGEAWAVVAAPYAEQLKQVVPWAIAVGVTWNSLKPRMEQDKLMLAQNADGTAKESPDVATG